jgi:beta-D-xylosidase 4
MEVPSEDPLLCGEYAAEWVSAFQGGVDAAFFLSVASPKHFLAYDQEGNGGVHDRTHFCAPTSRRDLVEYFLPPFYAAAVRGRAGGFMCAASGYGIDGAPGAASCAHGDFNNGVLRDAWGWEGHFVTDGNGVGYLWESYGHGALNCGDGATGPTNACRVGLRGGVDVELGETLNTYALAAIADGNISMSDVNLAVSRTLFSLIRLGLLDPPASVPWSALGPADVDTQAHRQLALETARQSIVLLRNNASSGGAPMLPLALRAGMKLAVIGPNGNATEEMLANYHGSCTLVAAHSPLLALRARAAAAGATVAFAPGCANVLCADDSGFADAVAAARAADVVVFVGGNAPWRGGAGAFNSSEGEEYDRANLTLSGVSEDLITAVLATGTPTAVVLMRGGPIALSPALRENPRLTTLVDLLYPGELGGDALADVLTGVYAPTGRLPTTTYPAEFVATRTIDDYNFSSGDGVTYQYYAGQAQEVFGAGLSYTTWALEWVSAAHLRVDAAAWATGAAQAPAYAVNVTNTGTEASGITVLGFIEPGVAGGARQKLFDFAGSPMIAPGASQLLTFTVPPALAARVDARGETALHASTQRVRIGLPAQHMLEGALTLEARAPVIIAAALP